MDMSGAIVMVNRGSCSFVEKAVNVQGAGAIGAIVVNNVDMEAAFAMGFDQQQDIVKIMAMMVTKDIGHNLQQTLESLKAAQEPVFVSIESATKSNNTSRAAGQVTMEQHLYVPGATRAWLQNNHELSKLTSADKSSVTWQSLLMDLAASINSMQSQMLDD